VARLAGEAGLDESSKKFTLSVVEGLPNSKQSLPFAIAKRKACPAEVFKRRRILSPQGSFGRNIIHHMSFVCLFLPIVFARILLK